MVVLWFLQSNLGTAVIKDLQLVVKNIVFLPSVFAVVVGVDFHEVRKELCRCFDCPCFGVVGRFGVRIFKGKV